MTRNLTYLTILFCYFLNTAQYFIEAVPQIPHEEVVHDVVAVKDLNLLISITAKEIKVWDCNRKRLLKTFPFYDRTKNLFLDNAKKILYVGTTDSSFTIQLNTLTKSGVHKTKLQLPPTLKDSLPQLSGITDASDIRHTDNLSHLAYIDLKGKITILNGHTLQKNHELSAGGYGELILHSKRNLLVCYSSNNIEGWDLLTGNKLFSRQTKVNYLSLSEEFPLIYYNDYQNGYIYNYQTNTTKTLPQFSFTAVFYPGTENLVFFQDGFPALYEPDQNSIRPWRNKVSTRPIDFTANTFFTYYKHDEIKKYISFDYTTLRKNNLKNPGPILCFDLPHSKVMGQGYQILEADDLSKVEKLEVPQLGLKKNIYAQQESFDYSSKQILFSTFAMYPATLPDQRFLVYDYEKKKTIRSFNVPLQYNTNTLNFIDWKKNRALFSTWPLGSDGQGAVKLIDTDNNKTILDLTGIGTIYRSLLTPDSRYLIVPSTPLLSEHHLLIYNAQDGTEMLRIRYPQKMMSIDALFWNPSSNLLYAGTGDGLVYIWELPSGKLIKKFTAHTNPIQKIALLKGQLATTDNYTIKFWNLDTHEPVCTIFLQAEENNWNNGDIGIAAFVPSGHYYTDKTRTDNILFRVNRKLYDISQFDLQYNRPDLVLQQIGLASPDLIRSYKKSYEKRLQRMNVSPDAIQKQISTAPEIRLINHPGYSAETNQSQYTLTIEATDAELPLDRINLAINGVPIFGINGKSISEQNSRTYKGSVSFELSQGKNIIDISALNRKGIESLKERIEVTYIPAIAVRPVLHLITISVGSYLDTTKNLRYATKDGNDLIELFQQHKNIFSEVKTYPLFNENATRSQILVLQKELQKTEVNDVVLLFVSGHGLLDNNLNYYLATGDIDFNQPSAKGLAYEELENVLNNIPCRQKIILLDACHSGEIDKEEIMQIVNDETENSPINFRSLGTTFQAKSIGLNNSFELSRQLFADLRKHSGTVVISAAAGVEFALESSEWKNGAFTYCLLSALKNMKADKNKDGKILLSELQEFLYEEVPLLTKGRQQPTSRRENPVNDFRIW